MRALALLSLLSSCAELRAGWMRVDLPEGHASHIMVCVVEANKDRELEAVCLSKDELKRRLEETQRQKEGDL